MIPPFSHERLVVALFATRSDDSSFTARMRICGTTICTTIAITSSMLLASDIARAESASSIPPTTTSHTTTPFAAFISEASKRFDVPAHWIRAMMRVESAHDVRALSPKGAIGLMQIMPATYAELRARYGLGADPYDPHDNILAGAAYIREMHDRYGSPGFLAAYNAGPARYDNHLATGRELPAETREYVATLAPMIELGQIDGRINATPHRVAGSHAPLFVARTESKSTDDRPSPDAQPNRTQNARRIVDLSALIPQSSGLFARRASEVHSQ
jgi:soluble lytic murein transglycosylase-like protein